MAEPAVNHEDQQYRGIDLAAFPDHQLRTLVFEAARKSPGSVNRDEEKFILDQIQKPHYWRLTKRQKRWLFAIATEKLGIYVPEALRP